MIFVCVCVQSVNCSNKRLQHLHRVHFTHIRPTLCQKEISTTWTDQFLFLLVYLVSGLFGGLISNECTDHGGLAGGEFVVCCLVNVYARLFLYGESRKFLPMRIFLIFIIISRSIVATKNLIPVRHYPATAWSMTTNQRQCSSSPPTKTQPKTAIPTTRGNTSYG